MQHGRLLDDAKAIVAEAKRKGWIRPPGQAIMAVRQHIVLDGAAANRKGIRLAFVPVTPAMAGAWLAGNNKGNRKLRKSTVASYAADMRNGAWALNHQGIAFDADDTLLDGQHRLAAIVESGATLTMIVSTGWPTADDPAEARVMDTVDRGLSRSIADLLNLQHGISDARIVVMTCNTIAMICSSCVSQGTRKLSVDVVLKIAGLFKEGVQHAVRERSRSYGLRSASLLGAVAFAYQVAPKKVAEFYDALKTGAGLDPGHPALSLRNNLLEQTASKRSRTKGNPSRLAQAVLTHCHAAMSDEPLATLTVRGEALDFFQEKQDEAVQQVRAWTEPAPHAPAAKPK